MLATVRLVFLSSIKKPVAEVDWRGSKQEFIGLALVHTDVNMWVLHKVEFCQLVA